MAKVTVTREQVDAWNRMFEAGKGTANYAVFSLCHEYKNTRGNYVYLGWGDVRAHYIPHPSDRFYIKTVKGETYLYWEDCNDTERWLLGDVAKAYFNVQKGVEA